MACGLHVKAYKSEVYERTFDDYCEILVVFDYALLFVIVFSVAALMARIGKSDGREVGDAHGAEEHGALPGHVRV